MDSIFYGKQHRLRVQVRPGDLLPVSVDPGNIHLFDTATGLPMQTQT